MSFKSGKVLLALVGTAMAADWALAAPPSGPGQPIDQQAELDALQKDVGRYEDATREYRGSVRKVVQREYADKKKALMDRYGSSIDREEKDEKSRRLAAIAMFENFLAKYANDDRWTPDAMFRLAELYFERAQEDYMAATQAAGASGNVTPDFNKTVEIYRTLIDRFPNYRLIDGAYYLMSYCLGEMGKEPEALAIMRALVCSNKYKASDPAVAPQASKGRLQGKMDDPYATCEPIKKDSRFLPEGWTRIGETHFDNSELEAAISAYGRVLKFPDSPYFDKALYKQAWSYYRADNYPEAIKRFDELVVFSDKKKQESGAEGSELRVEAVQYLGISFAEKDWNGDSVDDAEQGLERIEKFYRNRDAENHTREIFVKLGDIYFDETEYDRAIQVYKRVLEKWPLDANAPQVHDRIVQADKRKRSFDEAIREQEEMAKRYLKPSKFWEKWKNDASVVNKAAELVELNLIQAAVEHHKAAQDLKQKLAAAKKPDPKLIELINQEYAKAAQAYENYLRQYPESKNAYEYGYSYAETLFYSGRFLEAAHAYEKIRDSKLDNKYAEDASFSSIKAYEKYLEVQRLAGKFKDPPKPERGKTPAPVKPMELPEVITQLQKAYDTFIERAPQSGRVPTLTYKAAEIDYNYLRWDTGRPRMEKIVETYCKQDIGATAIDAILASYVIENNYDKVQEWTAKVQSLKCGSAEVAAKQAAAAKTLGLGARFKKADDLFAEAEKTQDRAKYEEAAKMYVKIVDEDPKNADADKALNNAAVANEKVQKFAAATKLYERIVTEYPQSKFIDDAIFNTAKSYFKAFDFDRAVASYLRLVEDKRFADSPHRNDALYTAASILEGDQNYQKAADLFKKYAATSSVKIDDQTDAYFRAAQSILKLKDWDKATATFKDFVKRFGSTPKGSGRVLESYFRMAEIKEAQKDKPAAYDIYKRIVNMGNTATPASEQAEFPAHAAFILAEQKLLDVQKIKLLGGKEFEGSYKKLQKAVKEMVEEYNKVISYKRATWTLAAYFRIGFMYELMSKSLAGTLQLPCPPEIKKKYKQEGCDVYLEELRKQIEAQLTPVDEEVVKRYGVTIDQAAKLGVSNEWTKQARQRASAYNPEKFPLTKDEHTEMQLDYP